MSLGTTPQQARVLTFLRERQAAGGPMPSYAEMAAFIGQHSKTGIHRIVCALEARGAIRRMPGHARAIEVVDVGPDSSIDAGTELALRAYCHITGLARTTVVTDALREYFGAHPVPPAAGGQR